MNSNVYRGASFQRGYGLGGTFRRFFNWIIPIVKKHALPAIESGAKFVGKTALSSAGDFVKDVASGKNIKEAAQDRIETAVSAIKEKAENSLEGKGINRGRKFKKYTFIQKKKQKTQHLKDIFD